MKVADFIQILSSELDIDFYTGVPDSYLSEFCNYINSCDEMSENHVVAANEGAAVGLAAGRYLATAMPSLVYMQNSGIGNAVNPICSLLKPYKIPMLFLVGWRGEPGVSDEPQHEFQGLITEELLRCIDVRVITLSKNTSLVEFGNKVKEIAEVLSLGGQVALVCKKGAFDKETDFKYSNDNSMARESILEKIITNAPENALFVSTTGKLSRELYELREKFGHSHDSDFLIVGSMGHTSMVGAGVASGVKGRPVYILDGDGSILMHMGSLPVVASMGQENVVHFLFNNGAHETVGGMPIAGSDIDFCSLSSSVGYRSSFKAKDEGELAATMDVLLSKNIKGPVFFEVLANLEVREDLGRPEKSPEQCRDEFMENIKKRQR